MQKVEGISWRNYSFVTHIINKKITLHGSVWDSVTMRISNTVVCPSESLQDVFGPFGWLTPQKYEVLREGELFWVWLGQLSSLYFYLTKAERQPCLAEKRTCMNLHVSFRLEEKDGREQIEIHILNLVSVSHWILLLYFFFWNIKSTINLWVQQVWLRCCTGSV